MENSRRDVHHLHRLLRRAGEVLELDLRLAECLATRVDDHPQVLGDGDAGDRDRVLEGHEQAGPGALVGGGLGDVGAVEADRALGHLEARVAHDRVGERRLAGAVRPHQRVHLASAHLEVEALEDLLLLGGYVQVLDLQISQFDFESFRLSGRWWRSAGAGPGQVLVAGRQLRSRLSNSTSSASVVPASARVMPPWTRVQSSFVEQATSPSVSCEQSTVPSSPSG